ncbi:MAG: hypothetical protein O3A46_06165 [Candidatus Poribacteria bacterium]|nr:hypothetical protein [Candidatus Poribacteria bacterium]
MNTPSHIIVNLVALGRKDAPERHVPLALGAVTPDAAMFVFYIVEKFVRQFPDGVIWSERYYAEGWQSTFDLFNSIPLVGFGLLIAVALKRDWWKWFTLSMGTHTLFDLPLHHDDAHRHFYPFFDWRFESPVSYWDPNHYGQVVALMEAAATLGCSVVLWRRLRWKVGKVAVIGVNVLYVAVYVALYVLGTLGHTHSR